MDIFRSLAIAFSMYSAVPMPKFQWDQKNYESSFAFFPLVGAFLSTALYLLAALLKYIGISFFASACVLTAVIVIYTGGFHLDGYLDTMDALCSHREREERIRIQKDPHLGAFALIELSVLSLFMVGGIYEALLRGCLGTVLYGFVASRALCGIAVVTFKRRDAATSLIHFDKKGSRQLMVTAMFAYLLAVVFLGFLHTDHRVIFAAAADVIWLFASKFIYESAFGGISGDTCGHFVCISEALFIWVSVLAAAALI